MLSVSKIKNNVITRNIGEKAVKFSRILIYPNKFSSERYVRFLREKGVEVGENVRFNSPTTISIDVTRPSLVTICDDVQLTRGTTVLTHDNTGRLIKNKYGYQFNSAGEVKINENVYVGNHVTILKDVEIGANSIISSCSLVNKDIPPNVVAGGVPAKKLMSLDEFYEKRKQEQLSEAKEYAQAFERRHGRRPTEEEFSGFQHLFSHQEDTNVETTFDSFEAFLDHCDA